MRLPAGGTVFLSIADRDKRAAVLVARRLIDLGLRLLATDGTARVLDRHGIPAERVGKVSDGDDAIIEALRTGRIDLVLNTAFGERARGDGQAIRQAAVSHGVPVITTLAGMGAALLGVEAVQRGDMTVRSLQERHADLARRAAERDAAAAEVTA
jgi:carbamoyl-phosphate synthase large subunit